MEFLSAEQRLNGSFGFLQLDGKDIAEVKGVEISVEVAYTDVQRGMDKDSKMTGRSGSGKLKLTKAYSRAAALFEKVKSGKAPIMTLTAWVEDPDVEGKQQERVTISKIKFTTLPILSFEHGNLVEEEIPFSFAPSDLKYLNKIEA